jgi:hypothetical protein
VPRAVRGEIRPASGMSLSPGPLPRMDGGTALIAAREAMMMTGSVSNASTSPPTSGTVGSCRRPAPDCPAAGVVPAPRSLISSSALRYRIRSLIGSTALIPSSVRRWSQVRLLRTRQKEMDIFRLG